MEIKGKIIQALPPQSGTAKATGNPWKKREYVLETPDTYPRKVCFSLFGERVDQYPMNVGDDVTVSFDLESREYNGRWYTDVRAWKVEKGASQPAAAPAATMPGNFPPAAADPLAFTASSDGEDLPF